MRTRQLQQTTATRRTFALPIMAFSMLALLALAAALTLTMQRPVPIQPPALTASRVDPWYPGGHPTGSVYDGGDYGVRQVEPWYPGGHPTGSVYSGE